MIWTKPRIVEELRRLHKAGEELSYNALAKRKQSLVSAAAYHFGSYRQAVQKADIPYEAGTAQTALDQANDHCANQKGQAGGDGALLVGGLEAT